MQRFNTKGTILEGFVIVPTPFKSQKLRRNRLNAALRFAKPLPPPRPIIHPISKAPIPHFPRQCHTCGRPFYERPKAPHFQSNPTRKYCTPMCQVLRPKGFDQWLERVIMRVLYKAHRIDPIKKQLVNGTLKHREISTDKIQEYILRHHGKHFQQGMPLMFTERIRQAARRLVALPERSKKVGKGWQTIAITKRSNAKPGEDKWERIPLAPDRGNIMLRLIKHEKDKKKNKSGSTKSTRKIEVATMQRIRAHLKHRRTINGKELVDLREWKGKYWFDDAGRIRGIYEKKTREGLILQGQDDGRMGGLWSEVQRAKLEKKQMIGMRLSGWQDLLKQNKHVIDMLAKERNKIIGVDNE